MLMDKLSYDGPIVLAILDGVGLAPDGPGNAVSKARTSFLGRAAREYPHIALNASGEAVGLIAGQMGNSEVGHNTMGAGRAIKQGIARIEEAFATGEVFNSEAWKGAMLRVLNRGSTDANIDKSEIKAVGASFTPRKMEGSYMPCFMAGVNAAGILGSALDLPVYGFSHQEGHAAAILENDGSIPPERCLTVLL